MARILGKRSPNNVLGIILIDSPCPTHHYGLPSQVVSGLCKGKPDWVMRNFETCSDLLSRYKPDSASLDIPMVYVQSTETADTLGLYGAKCAFLDDSVARGAELRRWEKLATRLIPLFTIPGNHFQCFEKCIVSINRTWKD